MKNRSWGAFALLMLGLVAWGCAGSSARKAVGVPAYDSVDDSGLLKTVVLGLSGAPQTVLGRQSARLYIKSIAKTLRSETQRMRLLSEPENKGIESVVELFKRNDISVAAENWRRDGYQGVIFANLLDLRLVAKRTGMMWYRKMRYFIYLEASIDLFDPHTGVKLVSEVAEISFNIDENNYQGLKSGEMTRINALDEQLIDLAVNFGIKAAEALQSHPWQTSVISSDTEQIVLSAGRNSGLQAGDRLAVYRGNRIIEGPSGKFVLPGDKVAEIEIKSVSDQRAEASALKSDAVQAGDIAVPLQLIQ